MAMEITSHRELRKNINKCLSLYERFPNTEYFVYDYNKEVLYMFDSESGGWLSSVDYELMSQYLCKPLLNYLYD